MDQSQVRKDVSWIGARLREPSTYAGIAAMLAAFGFGHGDQWAEVIVSAGIAITGALAIVMPEDRQRTPAGVARKTDDA
jgi:hypothetical protein